MILFKHVFFAARFFISFTVIVLLFVLAYFFPLGYNLVVLAFWLLVLLCCVDVVLLFRNKNGVRGVRDTPEKLSNGDDNTLYLYLENRYPFAIKVAVIDEIPFQFQRRDVLFEAHIATDATKIITYKLRPTKRGVYHFGALQVFVGTAIGLVQRRYCFEQGQTLPVYPSFIQMRQYELLAISNRLQNYGIKKIRRIGHSMEFEQIRNYVAGDDYRTINWKATARNRDIMVNQFQDEKSQAIYSIIDKGRVMKMPFEAMSLLDYAINASLVIANIAIKKGDKAGLITFSHKIGSALLASKRGSQIRHIQEVLYKEETQFLETDYEKLYTLVHRKIKQRSLLLLFTNFETLSALYRQMPYLRKMAKNHLLVVVFFVNTELLFLVDKKASTVEEVYQKTIAEKFIFEKKQIVNALQKHGIQAILTPPKQLTVNTINKYLELKSRGLI